MVPNYLHVVLHPGMEKEIYFQIWTRDLGKVKSPCIAQSKCHCSLTEQFNESLFLRKLQQSRFSCGDTYQDLLLKEDYVPMMYMDTWKRLLIYIYFFTLYCLARAYRKAGTWESLTFSRSLCLPNGTLPWAISLS